MAETKTKATEASVTDTIESRANDEQRADCRVLMAMFERVTGHNPKMWGPSIVGYGSYQYVYESGRRGEYFLTGFAIRAKELVVYLFAEDKEQELLRSRLGKHRMGKSCLYFKRLSDLDPSVLEQLIAAAVSEVQRRHGTAGGG